MKVKFLKKYKSSNIGDIKELSKEEASKVVSEDYAVLYFGEFMHENSIGDKKVKTTGFKKAPVIN